MLIGSFGIDRLNHVSVGKTMSISSCVIVSAISSIFGANDITSDSRHEGTKYNLFGQDKGVVIWELCGTWEVGDLSTSPNVVRGCVGGLGLAIMVWEGMLYVASSREMVWGWTGYSGTHQKSRRNSLVRVSS
jgi:hypothetical protein